MTINSPPRMFVSPAQPWIAELSWPYCPAFPASPPSYVIPGSQYLDPAYSPQLQPTWPYPRSPRAFESETRADGTGLLTPSATPPYSLPPCQPFYWPGSSRGC
jgi:hypothetical protein